MRRSMFSSMQDFPFYRILLNLVELVKILASCSPHKTFSPDVVCVRYARTRFLFFRRPHYLLWGRLNHLLFNNLISEDERFYANRLTSVTFNGKELVRYDYDGYGDLTAVYGRDGKKLRGFAYRNHIMVEHGHPVGLDPHINSAIKYLS